MVSPYFTRLGNSGNANVVIETHVGGRIGTLEVLTERHVHDEKLLRRLCDWHNQSLRNYFDQSKWHVQSTAAWLTETALSSESRVLFFVNDQHGSRIGLCGLSNINGAHAEVYDIIRGEPGGHSRLLPYAQITMLRLGFYGLGLEVVSGAVLFENIPARRMGRFVGFEEMDEVIAGSRLVNHTETSEESASTTGSRLVMRITRDRFAERHPALNCLPPFDQPWMAYAS